MATPPIEHRKVIQVIQLIESEDRYQLLINGEEIEIIDVDDDFVSATCEMYDLEDVSSGSFPEKLRLEIRDDDSFGTQLFEQVTISVDNSAAFLDFEFVIYNKYWDGFFDISRFIDAIHEQVKKANKFQVVDIETDDPWKRMTLRCEMPNEESISESISKAANDLKMLEEAAEIALAEKAVIMFKKNK